MFAITAGAFVPLNFVAVRMAEPLIHPRTFSSAGGLPGSMLFTFLVCLAGMALLWIVAGALRAGREVAPRQSSSRLRRALEGEAYAPPSTGSRSRRRPLTGGVGELDERRRAAT